MLHILITLFLIHSGIIGSGKPEPIFLHSVHLLLVAREVVGVQRTDRLVQYVQIRLQFICVMCYNGITKGL